MLSATFVLVSFVLVKFVFLSSSVLSQFCFWICYVFVSIVSGPFMFAVTLVIGQFCFGHFEYGQLMVRQIYLPKWYPYGVVDKADNSCL